MTYATPKAELIVFDKADLMIYTGEHGEIKPDKPWAASELVIRDIQDI